MENKEKKVKVEINGMFVEKTQKEMEELYERELSKTMPIPEDRKADLRSIGSQVFMEYEKKQDINLGKEILSNIPLNEKTNILNNLVKEVEEVESFEKNRKYKIIDEILTDIDTAEKMDYLTNGGISSSAISKLKLLPNNQLIALKQVVGINYIKEIEAILSTRDVSEMDEKDSFMVMDGYKKEKEELSKLKPHKTLRRLIRESRDAQQMDYLTEDSDERFRKGFDKLTTDELIALSLKEDEKGLEEISRIIGHRAFSDKEIQKYSKDDESQMR